MDLQGLFRIVARDFAAVCLFFFAVEAAGFATEPPLIPEPREIQMSGNPFRLGQGTRILVLSPDRADRVSAQLLAQDLTQFTGRKYPAMSGEPSGALSEILIGRLSNARLKNLLRSHHFSIDDIPAEGYALEVTPIRIVIAGKDASGIFYGIQTLSQLIMSTDRDVQVPGVRIRDWPALAYRGTQVDLSRGPVPKLDTLKRIVRTIAEFKMNQLNLYMEDSFPLKGQPLVGVLDDQLSGDDFSELVSYARDYHVEIIPATEGCGHLHKVLRFELYSAMGERPRGHDLAPDDSAARSYLRELYSQLDSVFVSSFSNIGCDETHELGTGRSAARVRQESYAKVYLESLRRAYDLERSHKQVIFWGDMAVAHPEVIEELPKDIMVATWEYFPHPSYAKWIQPFVGAGLKTIVCPWVGNTNLMIPNYDVAAYNIGNFIDEGKRAGVIGVNVTVWNDDGESLFAPNWWSIVYGAANAWERKKTDVAGFDGKFDWAFYRNKDHRFTDALKKLSQVHELFGRQGIKYVYSSEFGGANNRLFWHDPFSAEGRNDVQRLLPITNALRQSAEDAFTAFVTGEKNARRHADTLPYLEFAALKLDALGMRYQYVADIARDYSAILAHQQSASPDAIDSELFQIQGVNGPFFDLRDYTTKLREMYRMLWLGENGGSWLPNMLQLYDQNSLLWQQRIAQFEGIKAAHREGKPLPSAESLGLTAAQLQSLKQ